MAAPRRRSIPPLIRVFRAEPWRFEFYQAVRLIEAERGLEMGDGGAGISGAEPDAPPAAPVGVTGDPRREAVRFSADPSLAFPASAIRDVHAPDRPDRPMGMVTRFLGLAGALGPLPRPWTEHFLAREAKKDRAWRAFFDIFNHRLISLMVRVRKAHRLALEVGPPHKSRIGRFLDSFIGLGTANLADRMDVPDRSLQRYAGLLAHRPRTAIGLERMAADHFAVPVRLRQFVGTWLTLEPDQWTHLGARRGPAAGRNNRLGQSAVVGTRVWDQQAGIELMIGPMAFERFLDFLPGQAAYRPLRAMATFYASPEVDVAARLVVRREEVPPMRLGGDLRLGWTSWLSTRPPTADDSQVRVALRDEAVLPRT